MKSMRWAILTVVILAAVTYAILAHGENISFYTLPTDTPIINFQGRIEVESIGYSGPGTFRLHIGAAGFGEQSYWSSWANVTCVEGIFNILIGGNTDPLTQDLFTRQTDLFLRVEFATDGSNFETLEPDQQFVSVPYAYNAYLLDGLPRPQSAFVGLTDVQTIEHKTLVEPRVENYIYFTGSPPEFDRQTGWMSFNFEEGRPEFWDGGKWVYWPEPGEVEGVTGFGDPQEVTFWASYDEGRIGVRSHPGFTFLTTPAGGLTLDLPDITTGTVLEIVADGLDGGKALTVSSDGDPAGAMVTFDRLSDGPALSVFAANLTGHGALFSGDAVTSGQVLKVHSDSELLTGETLLVHQDHDTAFGDALHVRQDGRGAGARVTLSAGPAEGEPALFVRALRPTAAGVDEAEGGTVHIDSSGNVYGALTVYSSQGDDQEAPLVTLKTSDGDFDRPLLRLEPADGSDSPHFFLKPIARPTTEAAGMLYMDTDGYLYFYDGESWVQVPGDGEGDITGGGEEDQLVIWTGEKTIGGDAKLTFSEDILDIDGRIRVRGGSPSSGLVLSADDGTGLASWKAVTAVAGAVSGGGTSGQVTYWADDSIVTGHPGFTYDDGDATLTVTNIGAFTLAGAMDADGQNISNVFISSGIGAFSQLTTATLAVGGSPEAGQVLTAVDGSGLVEWTDPAAGDITGEGTPGTIPVWDGETDLGDSIITQTLVPDTVTVGGALVADDLTLGEGVTISAFSDDADLGGEEASDAAVSTQKAVKDYVDARMPGWDAMENWVIRGTDDGWEATDFMLIDTYLDRVTIGTDFMVVDADYGRVGIGTDSPTAALDVAGQIRMRTGASEDYVLLSDEDGLARWAAAPWGDITGGGTEGAIPIWTDGDTLGDSSIAEEAGAVTVAADLVAETVTAENLEEGRVVLAGTDGQLTDDADLTFSGDTLTATKITTGVGTTIDEFATALDLGGLEASHDKVPTQLAVRTYVDTSITGAGGVGGEGDSPQVAYWTSTTQIGGVGAFTFDGTVFTAPQIALAEGRTIDEFSEDGTLAGGHDKVPTAQAVKTYVDDNFVPLGLLPVPQPNWVIRGGAESWEATDFMVIDTYSGGVGIGTDSPTATLDIDGQIRIRGGTPGVDKVLVSDADGLASWATAPGGDISGSGTEGAIPIWTAEDTLGDSSIAEDAGTVTVAANLVADSLTAGDLTEGRVVLAGADGQLTDDEDLTFSGDTLTATKLTIGTGATIDEFSADVTLGGVEASDEKVPTQLAIKEYVDDRVPDDMPGSVQDWVIRGEAGHWTATGVMTIDANEQVAISSGVTTGRALDVVANSLTSGNALRVHSDTAGTVPSDAMVLLERTGAGRTLEVQSGVTTGSGVWVNSATLTGGNVMTVKAFSDSMQTGANTLFVHQGKSAPGRGLFVQQDGTGQAARFTISGGEPGKSAIWVQASRSTGNTLTTDTGGAIHVSNEGNLGSAITAWSNLSVPEAPLAWFKVVSGWQDQPVMALEGRTGVASPLRLVPLTNLPDFAEYTVQAGEIAAKSDGTLHFFTGTAWRDITAGLTGTGAHGRIAYWDTAGSLTGEAAFYWDTINKRLGLNTTAPHSGLTVRQDANAAAISAFNRTTTVGDYTGIRFRAASATTADQDYRGAIFFERVEAAGRGSLHFATSTGLSGTNVTLADSRMTIDKDGNVGIGTTAPESLLDVVGVLRLRGGDPAAGRVLMSDATGFAFWTDIAAGGGDITGSGADKRVAYFTADKNISAKAGFEYDSDTDILTVANIGAFSLAGALTGGAREISGTNFDIGGGTIDGTVIGGDTPAAGTFTSLTADDLTLGEGATISEFSTDTTLSGGDVEVPTSKAVKDYVDGLVPDAMPASIENWVIRGGDDGWETTDAMIIDSYGRVTIGTDYFHSWVEVFKPADAVTAGRAFRVRNMSNQTGIAGSGMFVRTVNQDPSVHLAHFMSGAEGGGNELSVMMVKADGRVGIQQENPAEALSVGGRMWMQHTDAPAVTTDRLYNVDGDLHWDGKVLDGRWTYRTGERSGDDAFDPDNPAAFTPGTPVRYSNDGSTWRYGIVTAFAGDTATLAGAPMAAGWDAFVQTGRPEMLRQVNFYKPGEVEAIHDYMGLATWQMPAGYVVRVTGQLELAGTDPVEIQVKIAGNGLIDGTLNLPDDGEWDSNTSIITEYYNIGFGNRIEVDLENDGGATPGDGLLVTMQVITP